MNEQLKQAYARLGLPEDITREELDKRFDLHLKRMRSGSGEGDTGSYEEDFQAFKFILASLDQQEIQQAEDLRLEKWGRFTGIARKGERFFRLYKMHTIISVVVLLVLIFGGRALYSNWQEQKYQASLPPVDASIMFMGNYGLNDPEADNKVLEEAIVALYPQWKRVEAKISYLPSAENGGAMDMTYQQKAFVELAADPPDILIMDEAAFAWIGQQEGLQNLEPVLASAGILPDDVRLKKAKSETGSGEAVVGADITDTKFGSALPVQHLKFIAGVLAADEKKDTAIQFLTDILSEPAAAE